MDHALDEDADNEYWNMVVCATATIATYFYSYIYKEPCMTSIYNGEKWMMEILNEKSHHIRCINTFRMEKRTVQQLCKTLELKYELHPTERMSIIEKVGIFLYTLSLGASNRDCQERFQRSGETISRVFHEVLDAVTALARDIIKPDDPQFRSTPLHIANDKRYMPYFKDCIGCIDGTHVAVCVPEAEQVPYRGRKGVTMQNVMAVCDFNMCFTFVSAGWKGSAHDTRVFLHAINTPSMNFPKPPPGKYYLVDKGYPDRPGYLVPFPRIRYHQAEFENGPPKTAQEAFNRSHSSLRSAIERSFGILKKRWKILRAMPNFSTPTQVKIVIAACALHNFIRKNAPEDPAFGVLDTHPDYIPSDAFNNNKGNSSADENEQRRLPGMHDIRNEIASMLWTSRQL